MKLSLLSFALCSSLSLHAADAYVARLFDEAIPAGLSSPPPKPAPDKANRYFMPGTPGLLGFPNFKKLTRGLDFKDLKGDIYDSVSTSIAARALQIMRDLQSADERPGVFMQLDQRSAWEREELKGKVKRRLDFYPGGLAVKSEVSYDRQGRRTSENALDSLGHSALSRSYTYEGAALVPKNLNVLDSNGVSTATVAFTFSDRGMPLEEDHKDSQGLPLLHRSYRYDFLHRLVSFTETKKIKIRGIRFEFDYDDYSRLSERRAFPPSTLQPVWVTQYHYGEGGDGRLRERAESFDRLPLKARATFGMGFDPRKELKYRWVYADGEAGLLWKPFDGQGDDAFPDMRRRYKLNPGGWLEEEQELDKDSLPLTREFWDWDEKGNLTRHEIWGGQGGSQGSLSLDYKYDSHGNWIERRVFGAQEPSVRKFEYYED